MVLKQLLAGLLPVLCLTAAFAQSSDNTNEMGVIKDCMETGDFNSCVRNNVERQFLTQFQSVAQRNGDTLCLNIAQRQPQCFTDNLQDNDSRVVYHYMGQLSQWPSIAIVYGVHWEWEDYTFISTNSGEVLYEVSGPVEFSVSPDGQFIGFTLEDMQEAYFSSATWIMRGSSQGEWAVAWEFDSPGNFDAEGFVNPRWDSRGNFVVTRRTLDDEYRPVDADQLDVIRNGGNWRVSIVPFEQR